jgi:hypothetical protein
MTGEDPHDRAVMLMERERQLREYNAVLAQVQQRIDADTDDLLNYWQALTGRVMYGSELTGLENALKVHPVTTIRNAMDYAFRARKTQSLAYVHAVLKNAAPQQPQLVPVRPKKASSEYPADFLTAYAAYPRKVGKAEAAKVWTRQKPDLSTVVSALAWQSKQPDWTKDGGQFVPHMATWLNQRRWEDEPPRGTTASPRPELGSWRDECQRVHGGHNGDFCGNQTMHHARMQRQVTA